MQRQLQAYLDRFRPAPPEWFEGIKDEEAKYSAPKLECIPCESYEELVGAWKEAMTWTDGLEVGLSVLLGVVSSTTLQDDQVWIRLIGIAGTAKTTLCEAIAVNTLYTHPMSVLTGLHSGYKGEGAGEDASLIPKINRKTAIINEGDVLLKAPNRDQIMSELRDLYSGMARCHYRNGKTEEYLGLRVSVVLAGTPTIRVLNKSALGDRFLDCIIYEKESDQAERTLVRSILEETLDASLCESNGEAKSQYSPEKVKAYQLTGGYVTYLRENGVRKLQALKESGGIPSTLTQDCESLGLLVAAMRTRPHGGDEDATEKELHIRLSKQLRKLALCLAVVLNRPIDAEVMRRVARVARDTSYGMTYDVCRTLIGQQLDRRAIASRLSTTDTKVGKALEILLALDCVRVDVSESTSGAMKRRSNVYRLTPIMSGLLTKLRDLLQVKQL